MSAAGLFFTHAQEMDMAKSQKRSNREVKKPKATKVASAETASSLLTRGMTAPVNGPKKKG
jgi:hypothetical protein